MSSTILQSIVELADREISLFDYLHYLDHPSAFEDAEKFLTEAVAGLALLEEPVEVADFDVGDETVYLSPNHRLKSSADAFHVYFIHELLNNILPFTGNLQLVFTIDETF